MRNSVTNKKYNVHFVVFGPDTFLPLLSRNAAEKMSLIAVNSENFKPALPPPALLPTLDEILHELNNAKYFSKLDLKA